MVDRLGAHLISFAAGILVACAASQAPVTPVVVPVVMPVATTQPTPLRVATSPNSDRNALRAAAFAGSYDSTWGRLDLQVDGDHIVGQYTLPVEGHLDGFFDGERFVYEWKEVSGATGRGYFELTSEGIKGTWGRGDSIESGGEWVGVRVQMIRHPKIR